MGTNDNGRPCIAQRKAEELNKLNKTIEEFYAWNGVHGPVENIADLLNNFFTCNVDPIELGENGKPLRAFRDYTDGQIEEVVYSSMLTIKFLVNLKERFDHCKGIGCLGQEMEARHA